MTSIFKTLLMVVVGIGVWLFFAPTSIGGPASYISVQGISMQPNLYTGDLVILHEQAAYGVGDSVAYRARNMADAVVIHRIIEVEGDRFVLQGDNNNFIDEYRPLPEDILGKQTLRVPKGTKVVDWIKTPFGMSLMFGIAGLLLFFSFAGSRSRRQRKRM
jgi:signal peptidase I